jgi:hypothetical protein
MGGRFLRVSYALLLAALAGSCEEETHYPGPLFEGKQVGVWQLDKRNGRGGAIPEPFRRFELRSKTNERLSDGVLVDRAGRQREYKMVMATVHGDFGPWLVLQDSTTGVGWGDMICLGCVAPVDDPEDFGLLVAFQGDDDGSVYPHTYERVE